MVTCTVLPGWAVPLTVASATRVTVPAAGLLSLGASGATWATVTL